LLEAVITIVQQLFCLWLEACITVHWTFLGWL